MSSFTSTPVAYIMEDPREGSRLERKVDPDAWLKKYLAPHLSKGAHVLDVGCGPGTILGALTKTDSTFRGTGVDLGSGRIHQAEQKHAGSRRLRFRLGDAQELEFECGTFDVVYARMLLQYVRDKEKAVAEMVRVC